jgi:hypothetical protein
MLYFNPVKVLLALKKESRAAGLGNFTRQQSLVITRDFRSILVGAWSQPYEAWPMHA